MKSLWNQSDAEAASSKYARAGYPSDLAIRVYTTRLLGQVPALVLRGGGNTSVKTQWRDLDGASVDVICVKGSGWDMASIEPPGLPAVELAPLRRLTRFERLSDEDMVREQRRLLLDPAAPTPSVEAILHANLPFKHVDHTHANAIVALTNQPRGEDLIRELFPESLIVPYVMPGFALAKTCQKMFAETPTGAGMILLKHGIFTYHDDPRNSYEQMIAMIDKAERRAARGRAHPFSAIPPPDKLARAAEIAPILRGAIALPGATEGAPRRFVLAHRVNDAILEFCAAENLDSLVT